MDRASDSGSEGWGFESLPAYQTVQIRTFYQLVKGSDLLFIYDMLYSRLKTQRTAPRSAGLYFMQREQ